jgi:FtsP/CotA-like multicopper oxidase with cupredoxin domain
VVAGGGASAGYSTRVAVVTQGSPVEFVNLVQIPHTVTSVARDSEGRPLFNVSALGGGNTVTVKGVEKLAPGSYAFYCSFHPNMQGTLIVQGSGGGVKPSTPTFPQALRIPPVLTGSKITIPVKVAEVQVLPKGPRTQMWTYGGSYPGPTIRRPAGAKTSVTFVNQLPAGIGPVTVHHHGGHQSSADDGQPDSQLISSGGRKTYTYPLTELGRAARGAFDFYHDHRMDVTGRNVWNGLQGMFIVDDPKEAKLGLPSGSYDIPLDIADRTLDDANQLTEPFQHQGDGSDTTQARFTGPYAPPGDATVGNRVLVNGVFAPHLDVTTHRYRFRVLNGSNFQSYELHLTNGKPFVQVGNGSGLLPKPVSRTSILLGPAERADVVVDFAGQLGKNVVLESIARSDTTPVGIGTPVMPLMQFRVKHAVKDTSKVPAALMPLSPLEVPATPNQVWTFGLAGDANGTYWMINGKPFDHTRVDYSVPLGATQRWKLVNVSPITHFIHLHEEGWRTVSRNGQAPPAWEAGLQDVWRLDPGESVDVVAKFTDYTGNFMIHCHMLDHEDHGMMTQFAVVKPGSAVAAGVHEIIATPLSDEQPSAHSAGSAHQHGAGASTATRPAPGAHVDATPTAASSTSLRRTAAGAGALDAVLVIVLFLFARPLARLPRKEPS